MIYNFADSLIAIISPFYNNFRQTFLFEQHGGMIKFEIAFIVLKFMV